MSPTTVCCGEEHVACVGMGVHKPQAKAAEQSTSRKACAPADAHTAAEVYYRVTDEQLTVARQLAFLPRLSRAVRAAPAALVVPIPEKASDGRRPLVCRDPGRALSLCARAELWLQADFVGGTDYGSNGLGWPLLQLNQRNDRLG